MKSFIQKLGDDELLDNAKDPEVNAKLLAALEAEEFKKVGELIEQHDLSMLAVNFLVCLGQEDYKDPKWKNLIMLLLASERNSNDFFNLCVKPCLQLEDKKNMPFCAWLCTLILTHSEKLQQALLDFATINIPVGKLLLKQLEEESLKLPKNKFFALLFHFSVEKYNAVMLHDLQVFDKASFQQHLSALSKDKQERVNTLLAMSEEKRTIISHLMSEFTNDFGHIKYDGARLTLAQIGTRKKYKFSLTVLQDEAELSEFLNALKTSATPCRERFVIAGAHWIAGDIQIDSDGRVNVLLIDSLALPLRFHASEDAIKSIAHVFPESCIYFAAEKRQRSKAGCSVFGLDDGRHLVTVEKYLPLKYQKTGLFGYLAEHCDKDKPVEVLDEEGNTINIYPCQLPLPLVRTMQSNELWTSIIPKRSEEEQKLPVNREKKTAIVSAKEKVQDGKNLRLFSILTSFAERNANYLLSTDLKNVNDKMDEFSLQGFKRRIEKKS